MNRVRIVAVAAVALGGAVVAGTHFQQPPGTEAPPVAVEPVAQVTEAPSLAVLAEAPTARPPAPVVQTANIAGPFGPAERPVAAASVLPRAPVPSVQPEARAVDPLATQLAQLDPSASMPIEGEFPGLDPELQAELNACSVWLVVTATEGAMLETSIYAPCDRDQAVSLFHAGMTFSGRIGADGQMVAMIPALTETAEVTLTFMDGRQQSDSTQVTDLDNLERVALTWRGPAVLALHAYEFGAGYGEPGHVHAGVLTNDGSQGHGSIIALGDPTTPEAHLAQVYSFPRGAAVHHGQVSLEIEIPVTEVSCGGRIDVNAIEVHGTSSVQVRQINLDMPVCDGNGGYLVLPGILPEIQIAMN